MFLNFECFSVFLLSVSFQVSSAPTTPTYYGLAELDSHPLIIKSYPAVRNFQSDLYEVYAEPYHYDIHALSAVAQLEGEGENAIKGEIMFIQKNPPAGPVWIRGNFSGLAQGKHGLHIHQSGDLREGCEKLGGHFNPYLLQHGDVSDGLRHVGDLGNVIAGDNGEARIDIVDAIMSLWGTRGVVGRAVVITENEDDLGRARNAESITNGNAGKPVACGVIAFVR